MGESGEGLGREGGLSADMIDKIVPSVESALAGVSDGSTILVGGFGGAGVPEELVDALIAQGATDLTIVNNNAGNGEVGIAALFKAGRVRKLICSYPRQVDSHHFQEAFRAGIKQVCFTGPARVAERLADIAGKWRAKLHRRRPNALDLLDEADPAAALRQYLAGD